MTKKNTLTLVKRIEETRDRICHAMASLVSDDEMMGDLVTSTLVDHENRIFDTEERIAALRDDCVVMVNMVTEALEKLRISSAGGFCGDFDSQGSQDTLGGPDGAKNGDIARYDAADIAQSSRNAFKVIDGDQKEGSAHAD